MNAGKAIYYLLSNATSVTDICGTRIYPELAEQEAPTPFVVYEVISVDPDDTNDGPAKLDEVTVDITAVADVYDTCADLASAIRAAIDRIRGTYNGVNVDSVQYNTTDTDVMDSPRRYAMTAKYIVRISRDLAQIATGQPIDLLTILRLADTPSAYGTTGQVLAMNATTDAVEWVDAGGAINELNDVGNVTIDDPLDRQALVYDEATGEWINGGVGAIVIPIRNNSPSLQLFKGAIVQFAGTQGDRILVERWDNASPSAYIVGVLSEPLAGGADGHAQTYGELRMIDTSDYTLNSILYASGGGNFTTTPNSLPIASVTRVHQNTGRIFIRLYVPGDHYRDRFRAEAYAAATASSIAPAAVENYYTAQANGDGYYQLKGRDTPRTEGDVVRRTIFWKSGAFEPINASGYTEVVLDDNATYADLLAEVDDILNANGAPITIWSKREEVTPSAALLDGHTDDLVGAFAPALLVPDYTGDCMRVRRSGDNAEQDIGFDGQDLDRDAIASFCSPGDGFVVTWYDQSGEGNHATQGTTANQPKIYDSADGIIEDGGAGSEKPAVSFDGINDSLINLAVSFSSVTAYTSIAIAKSKTNAFQLYSSYHSTSAAQLSHSSPSHTQSRLYGDGSVGFPAFATASADTSVQHLSFASWDGTDITVTVNSNSSNTASANIGTVASSNLAISSRNVNGVYAHYHLNVQAIIIYNADKSADRAAIETALNDYFNIY